MNREPNAEIIQRVEITSDLLILRVKPDAGVADFIPGQYVTLGLLPDAPRPKEFPIEETPPDPTRILQRAYSIGSSPLEKQFLEFYLAVLPSGALTSRLVLLKPRARLFIGPKITGHFTLQTVPQGKNAVMIATGTGIAPFISMLRTPGTWDQLGNITLIHGVRFLRDFAYRDELLALAAKNLRFRYFAVSSREDPPAGGYRGYVQKLLSNGIVPIKADTDSVFLCGNPAMVEDVEKILAPLGYSQHTKKNPDGNLYYEKYW
jgi:ferredoxin--NADP+ reductase